MNANRVLTSAEMRAVDAASEVGVDALIERAGAAVASAARSMLGGTYGRTVVVLAGRGNNGADGRVAARLLAASGVTVRVVSVDRLRPCPATLPACDLIIDAVIGTGGTGIYVGPSSEETPVLAVDIPSGVDSDTGAVSVGSRVLPATRTVTFAALKPGLLIGEGAVLSGVVEVADIGLVLPPELGQVPGVHLATEENVRTRLPRRSVASHKWTAAVGVIGGSPGMTGAPSLVASAALRSGAGMVRIAMPGGVVEGIPLEAVRVALPANHWTTAASEATSRCHALVLGPGLGRLRPSLASARAMIMRAGQPTVIDADGFSALAEDVDDERNLEARRPPVAAVPAPVMSGSGLRAVQQAAARREGGPVVALAATPIDRSTHRMPAAVLRNRRPGSTVLTPHDGEYEILTGRRPGPDRIAAARELASVSGAVVLLKGATTIVADPTGRAEIVRSGDQRLATAGTGDVLAGMIGSLLAQGCGAFDAAVIGAFVHGLAAQRGRAVGLVASDLPELIADVLSEWAR
jgi:ADP-dependent NAD(P)H-hydrate dehydratase / NAD(P)H-hydrate epimerase